MSQTLFINGWVIARPGIPAGGNSRRGRRWHPAVAVLALGLVLMLGGCASESSPGSGSNGTPTTISGYVNTSGVKKF